jgi:hypothetical protein
MSIRVSRWKKQLSSNSCEPKFMVSKTMAFATSTHHAIASRGSRAQDFRFTPLLLNVSITGVHAPFILSETECRAAKNIYLPRRIGFIPDSFCAS